MNKKPNRAALKLAMEVCAKQNGRADQLEAMLAEGRSWEEVARFAAYVCQMGSLRLLPWQSPPCWGVAGGNNDEDRWLADMLKAGISIYDPDPAPKLGA